MTTTTPRAAVRARNGSAPAGRVRVSGARVRRVPWVALGVILVLVGALVFGLMVQAAGERRAVVVAAREISPGQVIGAGDLRVVDVAIDGEAATVAASKRAQLVGQTATSRIPAGALLSQGQFSAASALPPGRVVVGVLLGPGGLPVPNLRVGDRVGLLETRDLERAPTADTLGDASVYMVTPGPQPATQFVSLVVDDVMAQRVADAAAGQRLRLLLRPGSTG